MPHLQYGNVDSTIQVTSIIITNWQMKASRTPLTYVFVCHSRNELHKLFFLVGYSQLCLETKIYKRILIDLFVFGGFFLQLIDPLLVI